MSSKKASPLSATYASQVKLLGMDYDGFKITSSLWLIH
ncbi:hypothetical protein LBH_1626 [Lactobacillus helveticus H9]|nr:hypothetical protein LBH_1626 [Lactobacillus helveticus H9]